MSSSVHMYNNRKGSFLFVNTTKKHQFKAKKSEVKYYAHV